MKKSELKSLIRSIVSEVKKVREASYDDYDPNDFDVGGRHYDPDAKKPNYGGAKEKLPPSIPDEDPNLTGTDEGKMKDFAIGQMNKQGPSGAHPGANKWDDDAGYDRDDPKHPGYMDRMSGMADIADRGEEDQMLGLTHDDSEPMFEGGVIANKLNNLFRINFRKLINLLKQNGFEKDEDESEYYGLTYTMSRHLAATDDREGIVSVGFSSREYDDISVAMSEEGFDEDEYYVIKELSKKSDSEIRDIAKKIYSHVTRTDRPSPNSSQYKAYQQKRDAGRSSMQEDKKLGVSTMKKSPDKKDNTQMGYEDKSITSTDKPTDKKEGKKLPIIQKKSNTQKDHSTSNKSTPTVPSGEKKEGKALPVGGHGATKDGGMKSNGLKEEILKMIRESITEMAKTAITLDPSGIVRGGVPIQYRVQDPQSPTGYSLKGYTQKFPDGTPVEAPKNTGANYKKVGANPNMGRPPAAGKTDTGDFDTSITATKRTEEAVEEFIKYNPEASEQEVSAVVAEKNTDETPHNLSPDAIKKAISKAKADSSSTDVEPTEKDITSIAPKSSGSNAYNRLRDRLLKAKMKPKI